MKVFIPLVLGLFAFGPLSAAEYDGTVPIEAKQIQIVNKYLPIFGHNGMVCKSGKAGVAKAGVYTFADCEKDGKAYLAILFLPQEGGKCYLVSVQALDEKEEK